MQLLGLESLKFVGQVISLETQAEIDVVVLRQNLFFSKPQFRENLSFCS